MRRDAGDVVPLERQRACRRHGAAAAVCRNGSNNEGVLQ